ncbi:hypothetical protein, partial [Streptosporangium sp. NPDC003464]
HFVDAALAFPTVLFTFPLVVIIGYWLLVVFGGAGSDGDGGTESAGSGGLLGGLGLGGVPAVVTVSLLAVIGWSVSLAGGVLFSGVPALTGVLVAALVCAWAGARLAVRPLRRAALRGRGPSRADFVGRTCVIRTGRVDAAFGQAEATAPDGSSALVQVRQTGDDAFDAGDTALIFAYDPAGEFFWVMPYDAELDPDRPI